MSTLLDAEIVNVLVLAAVLEADLGSHRKITRFRLLRPILIAALIVPLFLEKVTTHGGGLTVELAGAAVGVAGGLVALALIRVYRSGTTGKPVSAAGWGYALLWTGVIGARALFSYGANHWFDNQLGGWLAANSIPSAAITDGLDLHGRRHAPHPHRRPGHPRPLAPRRSDNPSPAPITRTPDTRAPARPAPASSRAARRENSSWQHRRAMDAGSVHREVPQSVWTQC